MKIFIDTADTGEIRDAAAMGVVMLIFVLFMFWLYDRIVGIDNMKLG